MKTQSLNGGQVAFLGGIHGVGKTYLSKVVAQKLGIFQVSASAIIGNMAGATGRTAVKKNSIEENQNRLVDGLRNLRLCHQRIILDGHYSLRGSNFELIEIGARVFIEMNLSGLFLVQDQAERIMERLVKRDGITQNISEIQAHLNFERKCAEKTAQIVGLPLSIIENSSSAELIAEQFRRFFSP